MPTRSAIAIVSLRPGWRTATMPSETTVVSRIRDEGPDREEVDVHDVLADLGQQSGKALDIVMRPWPWPR